jgi:hypothetical protein
MSFLPNPVLRGAALGALLAAAGAHAADAPPLPPSPAFDANEIVYDHSQPEWSEAYLQWIAAFARGSSPVSDTTGALCGAKQAGDVWFLASSDGTAPVSRSCAIPAGKALFVPIVNTLERSGNREPNCESMARVAADSLSHISRLSMTVDGMSLDDLASHRLATGECFALGLHSNPRLTARTAVADGFGVMLKPLSPGSHTIVVEARVDQTALSTTYRLEVR